MSELIDVKRRRLLSDNMVEGKWNWKVKEKEKERDLPPKTPAFMVSWSMRPADLGSTL